MAFFTRRRIIQLLIAAAVILLLLWLKHLFFAAPGPSYLTAAVARGNIESTVLATGIVKPYKLVAVGARATGRIVSMNVRAGQEVKEGDLLAVIDPTTQQNDLKNKQAVLAARYAGLAQQQAQLVLAQQNMARQQNMIASHAVSKADYDAAFAQVKEAEAQIAAYKAQITQAEADVDMAKLNLGYTQVTAPFSGTVLATVVQEGQNVNAVQSAPTIVILGDLSIMTVRAQISEADIVNVHEGQALYFNTIGNPNRRYNGKLESIEPAPENIRSDISFNASASATSANTQAVYYNGIFNIPNADRILRTYMTAEVHIILGKADNALIIPLDAIEHQGKNGAATVRVLRKDGKAEMRQVKIGLRTQAQAQVLAGLKQGEQVITGETNGKIPAKTGGRPVRL